LALAADLHELHRDMEIPDADLLLIAGDVTMLSRSLWAIQDFNLWLGELPYKKVLLCGGNHDKFLDSPADDGPKLSNATVLDNQAVSVAGLKVWGSPVTMSPGGAYAMPSSDDRRRLFSSVPDDIDVLLTHIPPYGVMDQYPGSIEHQGCRELLATVRRVRPKLHVFGHIHGCRGVIEFGGTTFVNAAMLGLGGGLENPPLVMRMTRAR
jgi:Icc-related predicted phosphoesterase